ncbi:MAG: S9 family peptidase [Planctomycetaceae bacterium]
MLTIDRLFVAKEFDHEKLPAISWSRKSGVYWTLEPADSRVGQDLIVHRAETAGRTVFLPASAFIPEGEKEPLDVESFAFSEDEASLLIYTNSRKVWRRNTRGDYWVIDVASKKLRKLGGDAEPATMMFAKFSPDGTRVAFVRHNNIFVQKLDDLSMTQVTQDGSPTLINGTSDWVNEEELGLRDCFRWSPDGKTLLFWQFDTTGVREFHLIDNTSGTYPRVVSFPYPKVGEKNSSTRLGVVNAGGGEVQWLKIPGDPREHYLARAEWTPDGTQLLVQQFNRLQSENRVMLCDPKTGEARPLFIESDTAWIENENPVRWTSDGKGLVWLSERSGWRQALLVNLATGEFTPVTQGEYDVVDVVTVDSEGGWLYVTASPENATQRYLYRVSLKGGALEQISPTDQPGWHQYDISPDAKWAIHSYSSFSSPPVVELISLPKHAVARVLSTNDGLREKLEGLSRPTVEFLKIDLGDGVHVDGWCIKPPQFDPEKRHPLLIHVYGEPHGATATDSWKGPRGLWHWMMAQKGCVVVSFDNRGTNVPKGRVWRKCVHRQIGELATHEQAAAIKAFLSQSPFIDASRVGVWGWSGGGSMSLNAIFRYPDLYHTAIAVAPNANQLLYDSIYQERYMGLPDDNADGYRGGSPLTYAKQLRGNLLLVHGTGDDNGHYQGTEVLMNELIAQGKHFTVMPYPYRSHSIDEGPNTVPHFWDTLTRYLDDHLISPASTSPTDPLRH